MNLRIFGVEAVAVVAQVQAVAVVAWVQAVASISENDVCWK
ncbi:hypothetical protein SLEP1_g26064 [Rubroshorea leprosula]|uniref:Uncharacterized protein n=1 Tax=Rubroshorea leprosula TaxID=152421 RepID=A0AAV5JS04_9ROSI|nr:hypothetical protein SLEP1_g26064 [Rubroshorea leprosula]